MEEIIRASINLKDPSSSRGSVISLQLQDRFESRDVEYIWSWEYIQSQFANEAIEILFDKYRSRIRHSNFVLVLLLSIVHSTMQVGRARISELQLTFSTLFSPVCCSAIAIFLLIWSFNERRFTSNRFVPMIASIGICTVLLVEEYGSLLIDCLVHKKCSWVRPRIGSATYLILLLYFLPLLKNRYVTIAFGLSVILLEGLISCLLVRLEFLMFIPDLAAYLFLNAVGVIKQFVDETIQRRAFLDLRSSIKSTHTLKLEQDKEDRLLLTIIPKHFSANLKMSVRKQLESTLDSYAKPRQRSFAEMYIMSYDNISILFADIVSFTKLTETLEVAQLITTLNELFGRFDDVSEKNHCLRIKIIGDCYYCISGIPEISDPKHFGSVGESFLSNSQEPSSQHALNCVNTGLEIIQIIREVREKLRVPQLDMRIGIHSGHIHCGLLGRIKWQYDIWSRDVTIANMLEQTGYPGKVHISDVTKKFLGDSFDTCPAYERTSHPDIDNRETFFVIPPFSRDQHDGYRKYSTAAATQLRRGSMAPVQKRAEIMHKGNFDLSTYRTSAVVEESVAEYNKLKTTVDAQLNEAIDKMAISKREQWLEQTHINPVLLNFDQCSKESAFLQQPDPLFKYNLLCAFILYVAIMFLAYYGFWPTKQVGIVGLKSYPIAVGSAIIFVFLIIAGYLSWHNFFHRKAKKTSSDIDSSTDTPQSFLARISSIAERASGSFQNNFWIRTLLFLTVCSSIVTWLTLSTLDAATSPERRNSSEYNKSTGFDLVTSEPQKFYDAIKGGNVTEFRGAQVALVQPRVITYTFALCMVVVSVFMRMHYLLKFVVKGIVLALFTIFTHCHWKSLPQFLWESRFAHDEDIENWKSAYIDHILFLTFIFILLHLEDRQLEYFGRLDYVWKYNVEKEQTEATLTEQVNRFLLLNILPEHVANIYINNSRSNDLYSERYKNVAVMFASIPNFTDFYNESDITYKGLRCLQMLNEIINDFDSILFHGKEFERIEKIKMVGSTFMAAAGLLTSRRTSVQNEGTCIDNPDLNTQLLVKFAICMMKKLDIINRDSLQDFQLRIGIACGPVIAGVVGENKPFYDIWGDTVNVASRMDTTGVTGRIQVTANCAEILMKEGFECECRGLVEVKGKGLLTTYFVKTSYDKRAEVTHL